MGRKLILGSSSPWRAAVLREAGYAFEVVAPDIDEKAIRSEDPFKLTMLIAYAKMEAIVERLGARATDGALIVVADQVCAVDGRILEKPKDAAEAAEMVRSYRGGAIECVNALVVADVAEGVATGDHETAKVHLGYMPDSFIDEYARDPEVRACAGALQHEHPLFKPFVRGVEGAHDAVIGMPLALLRRLLAWHDEM